MQIVSVAFGGFIGAILRYLLSNIIMSPISTFTVNIVGSFLLAWLLTSTAQKLKLSPNITLGLGTGLLGSFTTFSTFSVDVLNLSSTSIALATLYIVGTIFTGLLFSYLGYKVATLHRGSAK